MPINIQRESFIKTAKIPSNELERLKALEDLEILDTLEEQAYDDLTALAAYICGVPISLVSLVDKDRQWFKSHHGLDAKETPRDWAFCAHAILEEEILYIPNSKEDERFKDNPLVEGKPHVIFYVGIPLTVNGGYKVGTLCVIDSTPNELTQAQISVLKSVARQVESQLELRFKLKQIKELENQKDKDLKKVSHQLETSFLVERTQEAAKIGSWQVDVKTNEIIWSKMTYEIHEVPFGTPLKVEDGINYYVEEHRPIITNLVQEGIESQKGWDAQLQIQTNSGKVKWVHAVGYPVIENETLIRLEGTFQDIDETKKAEEKMNLLNQRLTLALETSNFGVWEWDLVNNDLLWDKKMLEVFDISEDDFEGAYVSWQKMLHPKDKEAAEAEVQHCIENQKKLNIQFRIISGKNEIRFIKGLGEVIYKDSKPVKMIGLNWDVTSDVKKELLLEEQKEKAEKALAAKSIFLANMSHEIRTPLNGIIGLSDLILGFDLPAEPLEYIKNIKDCGDTLLTVINDILDLTKIESGKLVIEKRVFSPRDVLESSIALFLGEIKKGEVELKLEIEDNVPASIMGDSVRIRQVLFNLVGNAIKFTKKGSVTLKAAADGKKLNISVIDTGIGISNENINKLFQNFEQLDSSVTREFGGTGLGLSIAKNLVSLMGGELEVYSEYGVGSEFCFYIPLTIAKDSGTGKIEEQSLDADVGKLNVLIAEDTKINQIVSKNYLKKYGINNIDIAENGKIAVEMFKQKPYDIVFMDIQMPIMDGYEACEKIKEVARASTYIIGLSANVFQEDRDKAKSVGMVDYLEKPLEYTELEKSLNSLIENKIKI